MDYKLLSSLLRLDLLDLTYQSGGGHIGGSLSSLDSLIAVYFSDLFDFSQDHFILSAGHLCPALYVVLSKAGYFDKKHLSTYSSFNSILQGHISLDTPGVEYASGSLGQGLSFAAGLALGDRLRTTICLTSDGEHDEGQLWEALLFANKYRLSNLINIVDYNQYQIGGSIHEIMPLGNLVAKYLQFGWAVTTVDGHDINQIIKALNTAKSSSRPHCIIAQTIFGKGVSFIQYDHNYHSVKDLPENLYLQAKEEIEATI